MVSDGEEVEWAGEGLGLACGCTPQMYKLKTRPVPDADYAWGCKHHMIFLKHKGEMKPSYTLHIDQTRSFENEYA